MLSYLDIYFANSIHSQFSSVLSSKDDILLTPSNWAISDRRDQQAEKGNDGLNLPFLSVWREPLNHNPQLRNIQTQFGRDSYKLDSQAHTEDGFGLETVPFETNYTFEWWDDIQSRTNEFNIRWLQLVDKGYDFEVDIPLDSVSNVSGNATIHYEAQFGTITDNSDIPRKNEVGANIRYTCELRMEGLTYEFLDTTQATIHEIALDYYVRENGNDQLVDQITIS